MVKYAIVAFAGLAAALPLNINLGAYSPALVVGTSLPLAPADHFSETRMLTRLTGDGEISFGGRQDVSNLITALEGAAVNAAAGAANAAEGAGNAAAAAAGSSTAAAATAVPVPVPNTVESASTDPVLTEQVSRPGFHGG
jgi:hypothetical protein